MTAPSRYLPKRSYPAYAYVPGESPHPTRDPAGHSYEEDSEGRVECCSPDEWRACPSYLFGVDLYNGGYLWEAHEAWEALWHACKHDRPQAQFIQGLIQCAAAALKVRMGQARGAERLGSRGTERLESTAREVSSGYMGLDVLAFVGEFRAFLEGEPADFDDRPMIVLEP